MILAGTEQKKQAQTIPNMPAVQNVADKYKKKKPNYKLHIFIHLHSQDTKIMQEPTKVPMQMRPKALTNE